MSGAQSRRTKHGHCRQIHGRSKRSPTLETLEAMLDRCRNPKNPSYARYGGRGIKVCEGLETIDGLVSVLGERPRDLTLSPESRRKYMTIHRPEGDGNYACGACAQCLREGWLKNVVWVDATTQARHRATPVRRPESYEWARSRTACHRGHEYVEGVSYRLVQGARRCLLCERDREARREPRRRAVKKEVPHA